MDYSRRDGYDDDRDLTDDDIPDLPDLVDIDRPTHAQSLSIPMTATSSTSSKTPTTTSAGSKSKKKKKKSKGGNVVSLDVSSNGDSSLGSREETLRQRKIWNTTTAEEKERIKEFWLALSEDERRTLVRVEKEHVHKRIKEGSKILNCSCHVCGRKQYHSRHAGLMLQARDRGRTRCPVRRIL